MGRRYHLIPPLLRIPRMVRLRPSPPVRCTGRPVALPGHGSRIFPSIELPPIKHLPSLRSLAYSGVSRAQISPVSELIRSAGSAFLSFYYLTGKGLLFPFPNMQEIPCALSRTNCNLDAVLNQFPKPPLATVCFLPPDGPHGPAWLSKLTSSFSFSPLLSLLYRLEALPLFGIFLLFFNFALPPFETERLASTLLPPSPSRLSRLLKE